MFILSHYLLV